MSLYLVYTQVFLRCAFTFICSELITRPASMLSLAKLVRLKSASASSSLTLC